MDRSILLVRLRPDAAAERSIRESLLPHAPAPVHALDSLLAARPGWIGEPLFGDVPEPERPQRSLQWVLPSDRWSRTPAGDATNVLHIPPDADPDATRRQVANDPRVALAEFIPVRYPAHSAADDSLFGEQWAVEKLGFPAAWKRLEPPGTPAMRVAVIDSGCAVHRDLPAPARYEAFGALPGDPRGHGTSVCGVLAAVRGNKRGIAGAAHCALDVYQVGSGAPDRKAYLQALREVAHSGASVLNVSLFGTAPSDTERSLIRDCVRAGIVVIAAAGNEGNSTPLYPAAYFPEVIAVGATRKDDRVASFSSRGEHIWICAPGVDIVTTTPKKTGYVRAEGTSFSTPLVSGACVLLLRDSPGMDPAGVRKRLADLAAPIPGQPRPSHAGGWGRLDLHGLT